MDALELKRLVLGSVVGVLLASAADRWPTIQAVSDEHSFALNEQGGDTPFALVIKDKAGEAVYKLECHNGDYEGRSPINFSGDFQCALFGLKRGVRDSGNLLATDTPAEQGSDWMNRGRMLATQLWDGCAGYAEYGSVRHFRLRSMLITFQFKNLKWLSFERYNRPRLQAFKFGISVVPDDEVSTAFAEPVPGERPPPECDSDP